MCLMSDVDYQPPKKKSVMQKVSEFIGYLIATLFLFATFIGAIGLCVKFCQILWEWVWVS